VRVEQGTVSKCGTSIVKPSIKKGKKDPMRIITLICLALIASACASKQIKCDGALRRINPPPKQAVPAIAPENQVGSKP